jgi:hypothetical protein
LEDEEDKLFPEGEESVVGESFRFLDDDCLVEEEVFDVDKDFASVTDELAAGEATEDAVWVEDETAAAMD